VKNKVLIILKPDCLKRELENEFISSIIATGLFIDSMKTMNLDDYLLNIVYQDVIQECFYEDLSIFMKSGPCVILLISGVDAIAIINKLKHELRVKYRESWIDLTNYDLKLWQTGCHPNQRTLNIKLVAANLIHVCDSEELSMRCAKLLFNT